MNIKTLIIIIVTLAYSVGILQLLVLGDISPKLGRLGLMDDSQIVDTVLTERSTLINFIERR